MTTENELRRTREKLHVLEETRYIGWVFSDLMDLFLETMDVKLEFDIADKTNVLINLKKRYEEFIKQNEKENSVQGELGI
jgi:hypothetical protein